MKKDDELSGELYQIARLKGTEPSFTDPANQTNIELQTDDSHGMARIEVMCKKCGAHLGHLFDDGPIDKGGRRYCINSTCLTFKQKP